MLTVKELLLFGERTLRDAGIENFGIDAETLLAFVSGFDNKTIFLNRHLAADDTLREKYLPLIRRRAAGEPLQYITGEQYFMGRRFVVDPSVLIPRPETELLAEKAISYLRARGASREDAVLDLCTGSGALAVSIAKDCPRARVTASDISEQALGTAKKNALALGVAERIDFVRSDLFGAFEHALSGDTHTPDTAPAASFDLIVTNPPYIRTTDMAGLQREVRDHEPAIALDGGADGLLFYRRIAKDASLYLRAGGRVMAEIGCDQAHDIVLLFKQAGFAHIQIFQDLSARDRILQAQTYFTTAPPDTAPCLSSRRRMPSPAPCPPCR